MEQTYGADMRVLEAFQRAVLCDPADDQVREQPAGALVSLLLCRCDMACMAPMARSRHALSSRQASPRMSASLPLLSCPVSPLSKPRQPLSPLSPLPRPPSVTLLLTAVNSYFSLRRGGACRPGKQWSTQRRKQLKPQAPPTTP